MKRKLLFITLLMLFCSTVFGQQHWTMADNTDYSDTKQIIADIKIEGETPANMEDLEVAAFSNGVLRGVAKPAKVFNKYILRLTVHTNFNGEQINFKLYDPSANEGEGKEYDTDYTIKLLSNDQSFGTVVSPVEMNFYSMHWSYINVNDNYMAYPCIIKIDGVEQTNPNLELAAFINNELRGVARPKLEEAINIYIANLKIDGNNGQEISFKLYVPKVGELETDYTAIYDIDYDNGLVTLEFRNNPVAKIVRNEITHYFSSLEAAVEAAQPGETVVLLQDVNLTETLTIEKSITINLNDKNVTLSTGGNKIMSNVTIKNGNLAIADVDTQTTGNSNCFISTNVGASLTFDDINMTGNGYTTHWAVLCAMSGSSAGTGSTINITNSTITLSNEKGSQGGFIKDQSGVDNYSQINISNSTLTLTNVSRGFTGAKVTLDDVEMTITGGEHGINGSELVIKNGSNVSISNGTGRAITLNKFDASIAGSNVTISDMGEGGIRYKTANTLTVDANSTLSETTAHADVDNAKLNDKVVRGTESQKSTVKVEGGVTTVINPVSGQVAYRAYIEDSESREAVKVDLQNVNALNSLAVKLYDANGNLLTTTTYRAGAVEAPEYLTCNIVLSGTASSSWETVINVEKLTVDNYPKKAELLIDGTYIHTFDNILGNATDAAPYQLPAYKALGCVYKAASITRNDVTEYYSTIANANAATTDNDVVTILVSTNETIGVPQGNNVTFNAIEGVELSGGAGGSYYNKSVTFDGLTFKGGKGIALTAGVDDLTYTVKNCKFDGVQATAWKQGVISLNRNATVVVVNNIITDVQNATEGDDRIDAQGQQSVGIYTSNAVAVTISGNTIKNVDGTGISSNSNAGKVDIKDNIVSNWGTGATAKNEGRAIRTSGGTKVAITGNVMIDNGTAKESFVKSTDFTTSLDASMNYWNGQNPVASDLFEADNTDPVNYVKNYYTDVDKQTLVTLSVSVAKVGDKYYQSVNEAINSADDGAIVQLLPGTIEEYVYPWPESNHSKEKSITILGSKDDEGNLTTTLTGGMYLGYDDSQCREHNIVVKDVNFTGKGILVACQKNVFIENNKFSNITDCVAAPGSANANAISVIGKNINATVTGNVIDGTASAGINLRDTKTVNVSGNTVTNTVHNSITIQNNTTDTGDNVVIENNTLSNWGTGDEGRAVRIAGGAEVNVNGNVMTKENAPEEFVKVTGTTTIDASANYWNGNNPMTPGMYLGINSDPALELRSYYKDAGKTELVTIGVSVAQIGSNYYATLQEALKAITSGCTLEILTDITISSDWDCRYTGAKIGVPVTINGNGKTIKFTGKIYDANWNTLFRFEDVATVKNLTLDASAATDIQRGITFKTSVTVDKCTLIGNGGSARYAVIVGEGAGAENIGNVTANITNSTFKDWIKGVTDNMNGQDMNVFAITGCTFDNTDVIISAKDKVTFTGNNMSSNSYVNITSYTVPNNVQVVANNNTNLAANTETECNQIAAPLANINAQDGFLTPVAEIDGKYYVTLQDAFDKGGNVKVLTDISLAEGVTVAEGKTVVLDLNGKTINAGWEDQSAGKHIYAFTNNGTLTINDSSTEANGVINARGNFNYGTLTLEKGTINAIDDNGGYGVRNYDGATFTMNGGTIAATNEDGDTPGNGYDATTVRVDEGATFTMNGGTINNSCNYTFAIENHGTTTIKENAGEVKSVHTTVANYGEMTISAGTFICNGLEGITAHALWAAAGTTTINGGTFNGKDNYNGFNVDASEGATVYITGGKFLQVHSGSLFGEGTIAVSGGTFFDAVPEERCAAGYIPQDNDDGTYGVKLGQYVAQVGDVKYELLQEAVEAVSATDNEIIILANSDESVSVPADVIINLNEIETGASITAGGNLTFKGNGSIKTLNSIVGGTITVENGKTLALNNFSFGSSGNASAAYTITGGTITANYGFFQHGVYDLCSDFETGYMYYSYGSDITVHGTFHSEGKGDGLDYVRGRLTIANGGKSIHDKTLWVGQPASWGAMEATLIVEQGGYVKANSLSVYSGSALQIDATGLTGGETIDEVECNALTVEGTVEAINNDKVMAVVEGNKIMIKAKPVMIVETDAYYATLAEAFAAANNQTVKVLQNITITETVTIAADKTVTLDLNGKTISAEATFAVKAIVNNGTLTINGNGGTIDISASTTESIQVVDNYGTLTIDGGTYKGASSNFSYAIRANHENSVTNIVDATITTYFGAVGINKGETTITDGKFEVTSKAGGHALYVANAEVTINGGEFIPYANGYSYAVLTNDANAKVSIKGGTFKKGLGDSCVIASSGNIIITGGTFATDVNDYCHEYYDAIQGADNLWRVEQVLFAQTTALHQGWNWYSSYVNLSTPDGLEKLQTALGENGVIIKSNINNEFVTYEELPNGEFGWVGNEFSIYNTKMYMIETSDAHEMTVAGEVVDGTGIMFMLTPGWNWIGYPIDKVQNIDVALSGLQDKAQANDMIKHRNDFAYFDASTKKWVGTLTQLEPGKGYKYKSNKSSMFFYTKSDAKETVVDNAIIDENYWKVESSGYANNMTIAAMLNIDGEIVNDNYEIAAFANGECRGSARPIYVESKNAYMLFMTVFGDDVEELTFKYYDVNYGTEYELSNRINYSNDAIVGTIDNPYIFSMNILGIGENLIDNINIYPNPTTTDREINLQAICDKVEVFNALGVKVAEYHNVDTLDAFETAGIYVIRITNDNAVKHCRLVVK